MALLPPLLRWRGLLAWEQCHDPLRRGEHSAGRRVCRAKTLPWPEALALDNISLADRHPDWWVEALADPSWALKLE
eukprot:1123067-Prorocentrum_lima.AAC.1